MSAAVTPLYADVTLRLHADSDGDGVADPGETLSGVEIALAEGIVGRTDAQGVVRYSGVRRGGYRVTAKLRATGPWRLSNTGANVPELLAFGVLLVVVGMVLRRRNCV